MRPGRHTSGLPDGLLTSRQLRVAVAAMVLCCCANSTSKLRAQDPSAMAVAKAMERLVADAIERAEQSVVAIARVPRDGQTAVPDRLSNVPIIPGLGLPEPTDPSFVPSEFASGVVIDARGLIVTNYHTLGNVREADYYVWLARKPYLARIKAADPWLDLAVLQIEAENLRAIPLGDAATLKKGQFVIALGNPYAIARDGQPSASWGIVSNLQRQAPAPANATRASEGRETLHHWGTLIQTDARLELGASGGPLINLRGEMVGLVTSLAALVGYERPGGFAIPVDGEFRRALESLKTGRLPDYGFLGVSPRYLSARERQQGRFGARIGEVVPSTPAAAAGLRSGDVITHVGGKAVHDDLELIRLVSGLHADDKVPLQLLRGGDEQRPGRQLTVEVTLSKKRLSGGREAIAEVPPQSWRGMRVDYATAAPLFQEHSRELDGAGCVAVIEVERDSPSWKAGLRPGDFISHVHDQQVATPAQFYAAVAEAQGEVVFRLAGNATMNATRTVPAR